MASMTSLTEFEKASVGSICVLVGIGLLNAASARSVVVGSILGGSETVGLTSKGGERLGKAIPPVVGAGTGLV